MSGQQKQEETRKTDEATYQVIVWDPDQNELIHHPWGQDEQELLIGRSKTADLRLLDERVSREHCLLRKEDGQILLEDLDSKRGTEFDSEEVDRVKLPAGSVFHVLDYEIEVTTGAGDSTVTGKGQEEKKETDRVLLKTLRRVIDSGMDLDRMLEVVLESLSEVTGAWRGFVLIQNKDGDMVPEEAYMSDRARTYIDENDEEETIPDRVLDQLSTSLVHSVLKSGEGIITPNARRDPKLEKHTTVRQLALKSLMVVPVIHRDRHLGAVYLDNPAIVRQFDEEDLRIAETIASDIAGPLHRTLEYRSKTEQLEAMRAKYENVRENLHTRYRYENIIGSSGPMQSVYETLDRIVPTEMNVVIQGETGTGKELAARAIHYNGPRQEEPFVAVNCARFDGSVLESELFGHREGAFTGADRDRPGLFERADGGTLFLDEIGNMKEDVQAKLLRVIEEQQVRRLGENESRAVDVRLLSATNRSLRELVESAQFREDLLYRLEEARITMPPLRDRTEDFPLLADHFLRELAEQEGLPRKHLSEDLLQEFTERSWSGNVREFKSTVRRLAFFTKDRKTIGRADYEHFRDEQPPQGEPEKESTGNTETSVKPLKELERQGIKRALEETGGNKQKAADLLDIHRSTLYRKMQEYNLAGTE